MNQLKKFLAALVGLVCVIYLANPSAGIFELIPDNMPLVGNLDEVGATLLLLKCLAYFGLPVPLVSPERPQSRKDEN